MSLILGIDPGRSGAIAVLDPHEMTVACYDMPDTTAALHDLIASLPIIKRCAIEKPFFPQMIGVTNAVKIAMAYGTLTGALQWRSIPFSEVQPSKWKQAMGLSTSKRASREAASQMFPDQADLFKRAKDDGRAEAVLIAVWASRQRGAA